MGSDHISLGFTVEELKNQLKGLNLKASGVKKSELEARLLSNNHRFQIEFLSTGFREDIKKRPLGERFPLKGLATELEQTFGIRPRGDEKNDLRVFEYTVRNKLESSTAVCLRDENILTNKKICTFCYFWDSCNDLEFQTTQDSQTYLFETIENNFKNQDIHLLKDWINSRQNNDIGLINQDKMIFSNTIDPFKPGFGIRAENRYFISRLSEYVDCNGSNVNQWSHIFHSEVLKRTLTIFEAVYLNSSLFQEIFTLNPEGTYNESYPTLEQAETFFKTSLRLRDIKNRKSLDKKRLVEGLENNDLLGDNTGSLHEKDPFLSNFILNTQSKFGYGFFDKKLEIFSKYEEDKSFRDHLIDLWVEVGEALLNTAIETRNKPLFQARLQAQLFIPPVSSIDADNLMLPTDIQLLRVVEIPKLTEPWILATEHMNLKKSNSPNLHYFFPSHWLKFEWELPQKLITQLRNSPRKYNTVLWPSPPTLSDGTRLNIFIAKDIYSAFAMNTLQNKYTNSLGDISQKKNHERFHNIMYDLFFWLLDDKTKFVEDVGEDLKRFWEEFRHPKYKRLKPLVALRQLSEFDFNIEKHEPRSTRFLEFQKETTAYGKHIEKLFIKSPKYKERSGEGEDEGESEDGGKGGIEIENFIWEIELAWKYDDDGQQIFENAGNWKVTNKFGREISLEKSKQKMIEQLLSWKPTSEISPNQDIHNVFFSPMICTILEQSEKITDDMIWRLTEILNQKAVDSCPIIFLKTEYDILQAFAGKLNFVEVKQYSEDIVLCVAQPLMPITSMSPNFLHVGTLN